MPASFDASVSGDQSDGQAHGASTALSQSMASRAKDCALGVLYDLKPQRWDVLPALVSRYHQYVAASSSVRGMPPVAAEPVGEDGFLGFSSDMRPEALNYAYERGAYPMTHYGTVRWYTCPFRGIVRLDELRFRSELKRKLRKGLFRVTFDQNLPDVMAACAEPRPGQWPITWINGDVIDAYSTWAKSGRVHSVEVWDNEGQLVGGLFGTCVHNVFVIESLFHRVSNSSKYGFAVLAAHLQAWGFKYLDYKRMNSHIAELGFAEVARDKYLELLNEGDAPSSPAGGWSFDSGLDFGKWKPEAGPPPRRDNS